MVDSEDADEDPDEDPDEAAVRLADRLSVEEEHERAVSDLEEELAHLRRYELLLRQNLVVQQRDQKYKLEDR